MIETENMTLNMIQIKAKEELISEFGKNFFNNCNDNDYIERNRNDNDIESDCNDNVIYETTV